MCGSSNSHAHWMWELTNNKWPQPHPNNGRHVIPVAAGPGSQQCSHGRSPIPSPPPHKLPLPGSTSGSSMGASPSATGAHMQPRRPAARHSRRGLQCHTNGNSPALAPGSGSTTAAAHPTPHQPTQEHAKQRRCKMPAQIAPIARRAARETQTEAPGGEGNRTANKKKH